MYNVCWNSIYIYIYIYIRLKYNKNDNKIDYIRIWVSRWYEEEWDGRHVSGGVLRVEIKLTHYKFYSSNDSLTLISTYINKLH